MQYVPFGAADKIKLSVEIIQTIVAVPTRSGKTCSPKDAMKFMMLCQAQKLNPFAGDAFLVGYDGNNGPTFSLITAHQAFLKRAEVCPDYDGMTSGIIIENDDGAAVEIEGDFHMPDVKILGGWARVFHKQRSHPTYRRIRLDRFNSGFAQWKVDPAGMICKCAEADALRSTFPTLLGGLYIQGETVDIHSERVATELPTSRLVELAPTTGGATTSEATTTTTEATRTVQQELAAAIIEAGCNFDDFIKWAKDSGNIAQTATVDSFDGLKEADAKRLLRNRAGLITQVLGSKGGGQ